MKPLAVAILGALGIACTSIQPVAVKQGDICYRCGRTITEPRIAAQLVSSAGQAQAFKTPGCLAKYLQTNDAAGRTIFVTDYPTGEVFPVTSATFVRGTIDEGTGERDYFAFRSAADAAKRAAAEHETVVDWATVRTLIATEKTKKKGA